MLVEGPMYSAPTRLRPVTTALGKEPDVAATSYDLAPVWQRSREPAADAFGRPPPAREAERGRARAAADRALTVWVHQDYLVSSHQVGCREAAHKSLALALRAQTAS